VRRFDLPAKAVGGGIDVECNGPFAGKLDREQGIYRGMRLCVGLGLVQAVDGCLDQGFGGAQHLPAGPAQCGGVARLGGEGRLMGQGFGATEVYGGGFEGVEDRDAGLDGEQVMVDVVAVGEGGGFCGGLGHGETP